MLETSRTHTVVGSFGQIGGAITGATNATPIVVTTTSAHGLIDGDPIQITGVGGNTNANVQGFAKRTSYTGSTFGLYSDQALTQAVAGNSGYTSGGAVSQALRIDGISGDFTLRLRVESLTAAKRVQIGIQDSVDGFVNDIVTRGTIDLQGAILTSAMRDGLSLRKYDIPGMRFGTASAIIRLYILQIDSATTAVTTCWFES
jgi:hypothetical protein